MRYAHVLSSYNHTGTSESVEMTCQKCQKCQESIMSGQIIATSHDLSPQMVVIVREIPENFREI